MATSSSSTPSPPPSKSEPEPASKPASPPKKPAPLAWSHPETIALIQAYQEKWYSVNKGPLKSFQWEEIAVTVAARCGFDEPSRTATQCRHKIEKLRKRYRSDLKKPCPNSWQYFDLMDQLERGPMPLTARPMAIVKSSSPNYNANYSNNDANYSYGVGYYSKNGNLVTDGGGSDESDEDWNQSVKAVKKKKSRNIINNNSNNIRGKNVIRNAMNGKRKVYDYEEEDDSDDEEEDDDDVEVEGEEDGGGREIAAEIRGFADSYMRMENRRIEMMRETESYRMEMEKKKMEMIRETHRKIISSIGSAFGAHKKAKMAQEN